MQQQCQVFPRREGIARQVEKRVKRLIARHVHPVAFQRQPEHPDNAKHACCNQHPQRDPAADDADKQEDGEGDDNVRARTAHNHVGQNAKRDGADQKEQPRFAVLAQEKDHQHRRNEEVEETLKRHARDFGRKNLAVGVELKQQKAVMHEEDTDADQGDGHQHHPRQVGFHPIHGKKRPARGSSLR